MSLQWVDSGFLKFLRGFAPPPMFFLIHRIYLDFILDKLGVVISLKSELFTLRKTKLINSIFILFDNIMNNFDRINKMQKYIKKN